MRRYASINDVNVATAPRPAETGRDPAPTSIAAVPARRHRFDPALRKRIASSLLFGTIAVGDVLLGGWYFAFLILVVIMLMAVEWRRLAGQVSREGADFLVTTAAAVPAAAVIAAGSGAAATGLAFLLAGAVLGAGLAALLAEAPVDRVAGGVLYLGLPTLSLVWLRGAEAGGSGAVLWLLLVVWATDSCAFFAGRAIGGPRLAPALSPAKTWAGLGGGMLGAAVIGGGFAWAQGGALALALVIAPLLAVIAQAGDLFESWLKRRAGLKDSGALIPGHGGLLDRVDGLLFAAPAFAGLALLVGRQALP